MIDYKVNAQVDIRDLKQLYSSVRWFAYTHDPETL